MLMVAFSGAKRYLNYPPCEVVLSIIGCQRNRGNSNVGRSLKPHAVEGRGNADENLDSFTPSNPGLGALQRSARSLTLREPHPPLASDSRLMNSAGRKIRLCGLVSSSTSASISLKTS